MSVVHESELIGDPLHIVRVGPVVYSVKVDRAGELVDLYAICDNCGALVVPVTYSVWGAGTDEVTAGIDLREIEPHTCRGSR